MKEYNMTEQHKYYTLTEDVKTLIQYIQEQAINHPVVEAANRLNWAIKKDLKGYGIPVTPAIYIRTCEETFKHPTINIGGVELPKPETEEPEKGTKYWLNHDCIDMYWCGYYHDRAFLKTGRVHLTKERAKAWSDWWKKEVIAKINETAS